MSRKFRRFFAWAFITLSMSLLATFLHYQSAAQRLEVRSPPSAPFDAIIVPGCPSAQDGTLSPCQARRAMWATILWERGYARHFITSGAAVQSPYVEAEALAAAMSALGVPGERIYLEPEALHTEENIYNALQIARRMGWARLAVASDRGQSVGACQMLEEWHPQCGAFTMDEALVHARLQAAAELHGVRAPRVTAGFVPLAEREAARAAKAGRRPRPPSYLLYPLMLLRKGLGRPSWQPFAPDEPHLVTWATRTSG
jgi:hypothetical protein